VPLGEEGEAIKSESINFFLNEERHHFAVSQEKVGGETRIRKS
jgi:hypothetical protein